MTRGDPPKPHDVAHPAVEPVTAQEHDVGLGGRLDVRRPRLVVVRVGVGLEDLDHLDRRRHRAREVAELRRGRDDPVRPSPALETRPAPGEQGERPGGHRGHARAAAAETADGRETAKTPPASMAIGARAAR